MPAARIDRLSGRSTAVALDAGFVKALGALRVAAGVTGTATMSRAGVADFPITGGRMDYYTPGSIDPFVQGEIRHDGSGLSLTAAGARGKAVELTDFVVDPGASVLAARMTVDGTVAVRSAPLFFLDGRTMQPLRTGPGETDVLEGTTVKLKQEAADLLNVTFGVKRLKAGLVVGVATITLDTRS